MSFIAIIAWLWWGILGFLGFSLGIWGAYQIIMEGHEPKPRYVLWPTSWWDRIWRKRPIRDAWLVYWFGECGALRWLENRKALDDHAEACEAAIRAKKWDIRCLPKPRPKPGWGYDGVVEEPLRLHTWLCNDNPRWRRVWKITDKEMKENPPRPWDWLSAGFWEPFELFGKQYDPVAETKEMMVIGHRNANCLVIDPFDDGGRALRESMVEAMEIEAAGGPLARGLGGGPRNYWWKGSRERLAHWVEHGGKMTWE